MDLRVVYFLAVVGIVQCKLIRLECGGVKKFVNGHNSRRLQLARGQVSGQPASSKMNSMIWDEELADKASHWARKQNYSHNPNPTIPSGRFRSGENIFMFKTTDLDFTDFDVDQAMMEWFNEYKDYQYKPLAWEDFAPGQPKIGHYTQMAWSDSTYLGCAVSQFTKNEWNHFFVVCNYGPAGNYIEQTPYEIGAASGELTCGVEDCSRKYGDRC